MALSPLSPQCQAEDTVLAATLQALKLFTEMVLTLMMRFGTSRYPNISFPSLLDFGTETTTEEQIEAKNSSIFYWQTITTHVSGTDSHILWQYFPE